MKTSTKIALALVLLGILGTGTLAKTIHAEASQYSIFVAQASDRDGESNEDAQEQQEASQLQRLAKITAQQAQKSAEKAVGGKANHVQLDNEDGNLIYSVAIGQQEVKVDAGNAQVLYIEKANQENNEANPPRSSIQVPHSQDNDREMNDDH